MEYPGNAGCNQLSRKVGHKRIDQTPGGTFRDQSKDTPPRRCTVARSQKYSTHGNTGTDRCLWCLRRTVHGRDREVRPLRGMEDRTLSRSTRSVCTKNTHLSTHTHFHSTLVHKRKLRLAYSFRGRCSWSPQTSGRRRCRTEAPNRESIRHMKSRSSTRS